MKESIESILNQTFDDFEFIIINDGSTDNTKEILQRYANSDPRITIINQKNIGLTKSLNNGIKVARGTYIARQDADDVSYPERFKKQIKLIESNKSLILVGGACDDLYSDGTQLTWKAPSFEDLQKLVYRQTPFAHSTAFMRTDICKKLGGYDESFRTSQDLELWMRFAKNGKLDMLAEPIIQRKITLGSISKKQRWKQFYDACRARWIHNSGFERICALYSGVRSLIIGLLPSRFIKILKERFKP